MSERSIKDPKPWPGEEERHIISAEGVDPALLLFLDLIADLLANQLSEPPPR